jgi:hypothetical protein
LILVPTHGGPTMFARIGVMRALNRRFERVLNSERHWAAKAEERSINDLGVPCGRAATTLLFLPSEPRK